MPFRVLLWLSNRMCHEWISAVDIMHGRTGNFGQKTQLEMRKEPYDESEGVSCSGQGDSADKPARVYGIRTRFTTVTSTTSPDSLRSHLAAPSRQARRDSHHPSTAPQAPAPPAIPISP
jgi:hypothetical protein